VVGDIFVTAEQETPPLVGPPPFVARPLLPKMYPLWWRVPFGPFAVSGLEVTAVGGTTYNKAGDITPGTILSGADVFEATEAGSLTPKVLTSGADVFTAAETGSLTPFVFLSGADVFTAAETGSLTPDTSLSGADASTFNRAGSLIVGVNLSGADVFTAVEAGSLIVGGFLAGVSVKVTSGLYTKTGAILAGTIVSGADVFTAAETGSLTPSTQPRGGRVLILTRAGSFLANAFLAGASSYAPATVPNVSADLVIIDSVNGNVIGGNASFEDAITIIATDSILVGAGVGAGDDVVITDSDP